MRAEESAVHLFRVDGLSVGVRVADGLILATSEEPGHEGRLLQAFAGAASREGPAPERPTHDALLEATRLTIMVAQRCNLRCVYCYGGDGEYGRPGMLTEDEAVVLVEGFVRQGPGDDRTINFFGGEPLLAYGLMQTIVRRALQAALANGKVVSFSMTTNAALVTDEIARWLALHQFTVVVSIDGDADMHGQNRPDALGRSSWDSVVRGSGALLRHLPPGTVTARATLTGGFPALDGIVETLGRIGFRDIALAGVEPSTNSKVRGLSKEDYARISEGSRAVAQSYGSEGAPRAWDPLRDWVNLIASGRRRDRPCGVGNLARAASSDGALYPCHRYVGDRRFVIGEARDGRVDVSAAGYLAYEERREAAYVGCRTCFARTFCAGGCAHIATERMDRGLAPHDEEECQAIRGRLEQAARAFLRLRVPPRGVEVVELGPNYLVRPVAADVLRRALTSTADETSRLHTWQTTTLPRIEQAYREGVGCLSLTRVAFAGAEPDPVGSHDWLSLGLVRYLVVAGLLRQPTEEHARIVGIMLAVVAFAQGLGRMEAAREPDRFSWAGAYTQVISALAREAKGPDLIQLVASLAPAYVEARAEEAGWRSGDIGQDHWIRVANAKHLALALPSLSLAACQEAGIVGEVKQFSENCGSARQLLDDYEDVEEDKRTGRANYWGENLSPFIGADVERIPLGHRNVLRLVKNSMRERLASARNLPRAWCQGAADEYLAWLSRAADGVGERWKARE